MEKAYEDAINIILYKQQFKKQDVSYEISNCFISITDMTLSIVDFHTRSKGIIFHYEEELIKISPDFTFSNEETIRGLIHLFFKRYCFIGEIYKITNKLNGKVYIGQTIGSSPSRWKLHKSGREKSAISLAIKEFGATNFFFEVIEEILIEDNLTERERYWINHYDSIKNGYNARL